MPFLWQNQANKERFNMAIKTEKELGEALKNRCLKKIKVQEVQNG